jgi:nucleoid DNA-binding protein
MQYNEAVDTIAKSADVSRAKVDLILKTAGDLLYGEKLTNDPDGLRIPGLGKFVWKLRAAHTARNPKTGLKIDVPEKMVLKFRPVGS